jgi:hypothetical protein
MGRWGLLVMILLAIEGEVKHLPMFRSSPRPKGGAGVCTKRCGTPFTVCIFMYGTFVITTRKCSPQIGLSLQILSS